MSEENVEVVERAIAAINERDIDGYLACCTEDIQLQMPGVAGVHEGADGVRRFFADIEDAGPDFRIDIERTEGVKRRANPCPPACGFSRARQWPVHASRDRERL
jgi:ketosteroid isomerase-like protein